MPDLSLVDQRRGNTNRIGFALQLLTLRYLGFIPGDIHSIHDSVVEFVSHQLDIPVAALSDYGNRTQTRTSHQQRIELYLGYRSATNLDLEKLSAWLIERAMEHDQPSLLFQLAAEWLQRQKLVRIGITQLERRVVAARQSAYQETFRRLQPILTTEHQTFLNGLLQNSTEYGSTPLTWLRRHATTNSPTAILNAIAKLDFLNDDAAVLAWDVSSLNPNRIKFLAQFAKRASNQALQRMPESRRYPILVAFVNGGYFVIGATDGTPGDLAGISIVGGNLVSEAVNGRTSLILLDDRARDVRVAALSSQQTATATDGATREVDGLNRKPGLIRGCGGVGEDIPTTSPKHDFTCTDNSELIQFTPAFGQTSEPGSGAEVVLDTSGQVIEIHNQCGGQIPANGSLLCGTGDAAEWLEAHAQPGANIDININVLANGEPLQLSAPLGVINGGPRLLGNGAVEISAFLEGFHWSENPEFYYRFGVRRNPRTLAGVTAQGKLLFVTVDGRQPGWSVGASFEESAQIMQSRSSSGCR